MERNTRVTTINTINVSLLSPTFNSNLTFIQTIISIFDHLIKSTCLLSFVLFYLFNYVNFNVSLQVNFNPNTIVTMTNLKMIISNVTMYIYKHECREKITYFFNKYEIVLM
ncbi:hypothetical protein V8G54_002462 [Vigna mungo]|uniref:Uncharacterized protein n=1 Tax=Vigna mungo TaxID=3915 RepID=A0AAQ3PC94_VIGMU